MAVGGRGQAKSQRSRGGLTASGSNRSTAGDCNGLSSYRRSGEVLKDRSQRFTLFRCVSWKDSEEIAWRCWRQDSAFTNGAQVLCNPGKRIATDDTEVFQLRCADLFTHVPDRLHQQQVGRLESNCCRFGLRPPTIYYARTLTTARACASTYLPGVKPRERRNSRVRWGWSENPAASAASAIERPARRRLCARVMRSCLRYAWGGKPTDRRKALNS